ncbi:MAG TPA: nucleotidyltransferase domain-containing protein [Anaerolineae bacterium]|nr:nucleotidyltransferase domain-containing protein [Anaerolineae bacterium]
MFRFPGEFTGRHIARLSRLPHATARLNLKALEESDILNVKHAGRSKLYSLNTNNILYKPLTDLFEAEQSVMRELENRIVSALLSNDTIKDALSHVSIYGSIAQGNERPDSDIDVFLAFKHEIDESKLDQVLLPLEDEISASFGNQLHVMTITCKTSDNRWRDLLKPAFLQELSNNGKLLYGDSIEEVLAACQEKQKQLQHTQEKKV